MILWLIAIQWRTPPCTCTIQYYKWISSDAIGESWSFGITYCFEEESIMKEVVLDEQDLPSIRAWLVTHSLYHNVERPLAYLR